MTTRNISWPMMALGLCLSGGLRASTVTQAGDTWGIENDFIRVRVGPGPGRLSVLDKGSGYRWEQPRPAVPGGGRLRAVRQLAAPPRIDGDMADWAGTPVDVRIPHTMTADAKKVDSDADCSARVRSGWDARFFYLAAVVRDDDLEFARAGRQRWWDKDSVEFWVDATQIGLNLSAQGCQARTATAPIDGVTVAMKPLADGKGYSVEARVPWPVVHVANPRPGRRFRFAVGINDADATGTREGQLYFPPTWRHSTPATFAEFALADAAGRIPKEQAPATWKFHDIEPVTNPAGIRLRTSLGTPQKLDIVLTLTVPDDEADLVIDIDMPDRSLKVFRQFVVLPPLLLDTPDAALAVADYCNGHLYPLNVNPFPRSDFFNGNRLDMPWVGIVDVKKGFGYALILDTSDDCGVRLRQEQTAKGRFRGPAVEWWASNRTFRYPRRMRYRFRAKGGYVALAKAYRAYAGKLGLLKTLAQKAKENPNVRRLFGAPDVWGDASFEFARQAKALGVDKMLIHGESIRENMERVNKLGYLTSRYDNYTDILPFKPGEKVRHNRGHIPGDVVLRADGKRQTAWLTFDKKTQYMKRCPALWLDTAKQTIPTDLAAHPYLARFIDVTTAEALYECFDPNHPLTRTDKRHCGQQLEKLVWDLGLVGGGEHGIWWGVRAMCYVEGMMSGGNGNFSWPAGHLRHPKTKNEAFTSPWGRKLPPFSKYEEFGIGHRYRVPLWELAFHDCVVTTWYWGDASDWLLDAAPEITQKKDAFNILYGTIPLLWANRDGAWMRDRDVFLRTVRNTCKLHEQIAGEEMLSHEFLTPDRAVQRTVFSSGTEVVVNFGKQPRKVTVKGAEFLLPQNGFAVRGPAIRQSLSLNNGKPVTVIETAGYRYEEREGGGVTLSRQAPGRIHVLAAAGTTPAVLRVERVAANEWTPKQWLLYRLDSDGARAEFVARADPAGGVVTVPPSKETTAYELLYGPASNRPDRVVIAMEGQGGNIDTAIGNYGYGTSRTTVRCYLDRVAADRVLAGSTSTIGGSSWGPSHLTFDLRSEQIWAGIHHVLCTVQTDPPTADLCPRNNTARLEVRTNPPADFWDGRVIVSVDPGGVDRTDQVLQVKLDLRHVAKRLRLSSPVDPASIRVAATGPDGKPGNLLVSEFVADSAKEGLGRATGTLYWLPERPFPASAVRQFKILFKTGKSGVWPPAGDHWDASTQTIRMPGYVLRFANGVPSSLRPVVDGRPSPDFLESLIYSSEKTGWALEADSKLLEITCLSDGPLRCVIRVKKALRTGVEYAKTYAFFPTHFDLEITTDRRSGCILSRAHFRLPGKYIDDKGVTAAMDGKGDENRATYGKNQNPKWFAVLGKGWTLSCLARGKYAHVAYWDGEHMGAIGFVGPENTPARMTYFVHGPQKNAEFTRRDWQQTTTPLRCRLLWP